MRGARSSSKSVEAYVLADVVFESTVGLYLKKIKHLGSSTSNIPLFCFIFTQLPLEIPNVPISPLSFLSFAQPLSRIATHTNREVSTLPLPFFLFFHHFPHNLWIYRLLYFCFYCFTASIVDCFWWVSEDLIKYSN